MEDNLNPELICPKCDVKFEDKPPWRPHWSLWILIGIFGFAFGILISGGLGLALAELFYYFGFHEVFGFVIALLILFICFIGLFVWNRRIAWKRRCPYCGGKFTIPEREREGRYRRSLLHPAFELFSFIFPSLGERSDGTRSQSLALMWLSLVTMGIILISYLLIHIVNRQDDVHILEGWDVVESLYFQAGCWLLLCGVVLSLGYGLRNFGMTPLLMLFILIILVVGSVFIIAFPAMEFGAENRVPMRTISLNEYSKITKFFQVENNMLDILSDRGTKPEFRRALADYMMDRVEPYCEETLIYLRSWEKDPEMIKKLDAMLTNARSKKENGQ